MSCTIVHVLEAAFAGVGRHVLDLAREQANRGYDVHVVYSPLRQSDAFAKERQKVHMVGWHELAMTRSPGPADATAVRLLYRKLLELNPAVVHGHSSKGGALARMAAPVRAKVLYTPHAIYTMNPALDGKHRMALTAVERVMAARTDKIIAVSPEERLHLVESRIPADKVALIPNGVGPRPNDLVDQVRLELDIPLDKPIVGFVGRLDHQKAPDVLIDVCSAVGKADPEPHFAIIGDGPLVDETNRHAQQSDVANRIHLLGHQPGRWAMAAFDVFLLPSRYEGFPYVLIEAAQAGLPIVTTTGAAARLIVGNDHNGYVTAVDDVDALARAVQQALDPATNKRLGHASREMAAPFTTDAMADGVDTVMAELGVSGATPPIAVARARYGPRAGVGVPLLVGLGQLGWRTMGQALAEAANPCEVIVHNIMPPRPMPHQLATTKGTARNLKQTGTAVASQTVDRAFRNRTQRLERVLAVHGHSASHVHCFGHLVAVPEVLARHRLTYSVTADLSWADIADGDYHIPSTAGSSADGTLTASSLAAWHNRALQASRRLHVRRRANLEPEVFGNATFVSCTSHWAAQTITGRFDVNPAVVHVDPFPIRLDPPPTRRRADADWITFIGGDYLRKGGDRLLRWHQQHLAGRAELHVVTSAPPPSDLHQLHNVVWHGPTANAVIRAEILPKTRVLVLPTWFDQSPIVLTEAAAAHVPAVSSAICGIPELIVDDQTGYTLAPTDDHGYIEAVSRLVDDPGLADQLGEQAGRHYERELRSEDSTGRLLDRVRTDPANRPVASTPG